MLRRLTSLSSHLLLACAFCSLSRRWILPAVSGSGFTVLKSVNNEEVCSASPADHVFPVRSRVDCTRVCSQFGNGTTCSFANYRSNAKNSSCELFLYRPNKFTVEPGCVHMQQTTEGMCITGANVARTNAVNCSYPFTYNGSIWYRCAPNLINGTTRCEPYGCLLANYTPAICYLPIDYTAAIVKRNLTVSGQVAQVLSVHGWIVMQQRVDLVSTWDFVWTVYKAGFGTLGAGNYWLGLENIYQLTNGAGATYQLRIELQENVTGSWYSVEYNKFSVGNESIWYRLSVSGLVGDAALKDPLQSTVTTGNLYHNGMNFSTCDNDNDKSPLINCAQTRKGGWWFNNCYWWCPNADGSKNDMGPIGGPLFYWKQTRMLLRNRY